MLTFQKICCIFVRETRTRFIYSYMLLTLLLTSIIDGYAVCAADCAGRCWRVMKAEIINF